MLTRSQCVGEEFILLEDGQGLDGRQWDTWTGTHVDQELQFSLQVLVPHRRVVLLWNRHSLVVRRLALDHQVAVVLIPLVTGHAAAIPTVYHGFKTTFATRYFSFVYIDVEVCKSPGLSMLWREKLRFEFYFPTYITYFFP